jgi:hypothetical protein
MASPYLGNKLKAQCTQSATKTGMNENLNSPLNKAWRQMVLLAERSEARSPLPTFSVVSMEIDLTFHAHTHIGRSPRILSFFLVFHSNWSTGRRKASSGQICETAQFSWLTCRGVAKGGGGRQPPSGFSGGPNGLPLKDIYVI